MTQLRLLGRRRFLPLFLTQFLGAFNDNAYKNALVIIITFQGASVLGMDSTMLVVASAGLFIFPFFLFSAVAGQLADKCEKSRLIRAVKLAEVLIMGAAGIGFWLDSLPILLGVLFLMGTQSTMFGPLKYGIIPQHLPESDLTGANGLIQMGTFLAILLGTVFGGLLAADPERGELWITIAVLSVAGLGLAASRGIPDAPPAEPGLRLRWNVIRETWRLMGFARERRDVFIAIIAISWFWFVGATFLSLIPAFARDNLGGNAQVVTLLLALFSVGIGVGSLSCERLSRGRIELGLVPLGALGITAFGVDLYLAGTAGSGSGITELSVAELLVRPGSWRVVLDFTALALFGGFYIVPLYAAIQHRSDPHRRARIIAALNVINALLMVISALFTTALLAAGANVAEVFLVTAAANLVVLTWLLRSQPELRRRFVAWLLRWRAPPAR